MTSAVEAGWLADPTGSHSMRYWDGSAWTEHVSDGGAAATDPLPPGPPPPPPGAAPAPPPPPPDAAPAASTGKGGWKDKLKAAANTAAQQGKAMADQAKTAVADQQAKRTEQWANDPNTLWFGSSKSLAGGATGMAKASYRITKDRVWIESGMLGTKSESVPLYTIMDLDVRQNVMQRGKDVGDVVLILEDPSFGVDPASTFSMAGASQPGATTSGQVLLDNIEGPHAVRDLLMPLVSEARAKKLAERQTQYLNVNPGMGVAAGMAVPPAAPAPPTAPAGPPVDVADQLRKLASLRDEGILSEDEFAAQKAKLLGG